MIFKEHKNQKKFWMDEKNKLPKSAPMMPKMEILVKGGVVE
jgi:hypothetical protein